MEELSAFLANPIVSAIGYILSVIAACIAIFEALAKRNALKLASDLNVKIGSIKEENNSIKEENYNLKLSIREYENNNNVTQGDRSQYFNENSGPVTIDNRG